MPPDDRSPSRDAITRALLSFGQAWNDYQVRGFEHVPLDRPALIVFYHGLLPIDAWYFGAWLYQRTGRLPRALGEKLLFEIPVVREVCSHFGVVPGTRESAVRLLREGHLVGVSPGGVREAIAGRARAYDLVWGERLGFAHVALQAGVDIVPAFAENIDEAYRSPGVHARIIQGFYERTRIPVVPIVGLGLLPFPVPIRTWFGPPVRHEPGESAESLRDRTATAVRALIAEHQVGPPRLPRALLARVRQRGQGG